jgi:hypothetical protein
MTRRSSAVPHQLRRGISKSQYARTLAGCSRTWTCRSPVAVGPTQAGHSRFQCSRRSPRQQGLGTIVNNCNGVPARATSTDASRATAASRSASARRRTVEGNARVARA